MKKNNQPFSRPRGVKLAFTGSFNSFLVHKGKFFGSLKQTEKWHEINEVPGTLTTSCIPDEKGLYAVSVKFRVALADESTTNELNRYTNNKLVMRYTSAAGLGRLLGTKENPLRFTFSEVEGFDGYECTLTGMQKVPESFI
ncbi:MAG TPA: hypothetical protein VK152_00275 [Paludibacter sp.]|nr:hypothetical protein [Paludibacter sp.]